jgi:ABC-type uncharacterized transport system auxiliary subunit
MIALHGLRAWMGAAATLLLAACMSIGNGGPSAPHAYHALHDPAPLPASRAEPIVASLLIRALPADALADTVSIAYSPRPNEYAFYQLASWTERPLRQLPRLLQHRLEARGIAAAVGLEGDPLRANWVLTLRIGTLHHDVAAPPGAARLALTAELYDRRKRQRIAQRSFEADTPTARADSAAAAAAMSQSLASVFDALQPWLEAELQAAVAVAVAVAAR